MPRRNHKAKTKGFESMSGQKIRALLESLQYEWRMRVTPAQKAAFFESVNGDNPPMIRRPAEVDRW